eukprot:c16352_g1_i3.p1 GENE.c16352_g1_i3~~c16352_g1_i3.p1  ORF type:complete len:171 (+),score=11.05 c16352_g1_i3:66-578(+)
MATVRVVDFLDACWDGDVYFVESSLERDPSFAMCSNLYGQTPLHWAASCGHIDVMEILLRHGSPVNARDINQRTPLHYACSFGEIQSSRMLIAHGADWRLPAQNMQTPVDEARSKGHRHVVDLIYGLRHRERLATFLMGTHPVVGTRSPVSFLTQDAIGLIVQSVLFHDN